jgi:hypothetical protein
MISDKPEPFPKDDGRARDAGRGITEARVIEPRRKLSGMTGTGGTGSPRLETDDFRLCSEIVRDLEYFVRVESETGAALWPTEVAKGSANMTPEILAIGACPNGGFDVNLSIQADNSAAPGPVGDIGGLLSGAD